MTYPGALSNPILARIGVSLIGQVQGPVLITRIFITANPVLQTNFTLENTKTLTGNFRVGALCVLPTSATTVTLLGQAASASNYFKVLSTGFASISIGGSVVISTVLATKDSKLRIYDVELSGNDFLFQEDGVTIDTVTDAVAAANSFVIDVIAQSNGGDFFDGTLSDPLLTDLTTPSNSESWAINRAFPATTEQSSSGNNILTYNNALDSTRRLFTFIDGDWLLVELVVNGGFDTDTSGWTINNDGSIASESGELHLVTGSTFPTDAKQTLQIFEGLTYLVSYSSRVGANASGGAKATLVIGDSSLNNTSNTNQSISGILTATNSTELTLRGNDGTQGHDFFFDNVSVKRIIEVA